MKKWLYILIISLAPTALFGQLAVKYAAQRFIHRTADVIRAAHKELGRQDSLLLTGEFTRSMGLQRYALKSIEVENYYEAMEFSYFAREEAFKVFAKYNSRVKEGLRSYNTEERNYIKEFRLPVNVQDQYNINASYQTDKAYQYDLKLKKIDVDD